MVGGRGDASDDLLPGETLPDLGHRERLVPQWDVRRVSCESAVITGSLARVKVVGIAKAVARSYPTRAARCNGA